MILKQICCFSLDDENYESGLQEHGSSNNTSFSSYDGPLPTVDELLKLPNQEYGEHKIEESPETIEANKQTEIQLEYLTYQIAENKKERESREENARKRDTLVKELSTESVLKDSISEMLPYLQGICDAKISSSRHQTFQGVGRWGMATCTDSKFQVFTEPLSIQQILLVDKELDSLDRNISDWSDYKFKVLIPEVVLKIYMNRFQLDRSQAECVLSQTPVPEEKSVPVRRGLKFTFKDGVIGKYINFEKCWKLFVEH